MRAACARGASAGSPPAGPAWPASAHSASGSAGPPAQRRPYYLLPALPFNYLLSTYQLRTNHLLSAYTSQWDISPVSSLPDYETLSEEDPSLLGKTVMLKLNGGLGTGMGLEKAKSLLTLRDRMPFRLQPSHLALIRV